jgi:hypothetical protein
VILDNPRADLIEVPTSSYDLSLFSLKAGSHPDEGVGVMPGGLLSVSIGELWPGIDQLDEAGPKGTSVVLVLALRDKKEWAKVARVLAKEPR